MKKLRKKGERMGFLPISKEDMNNKGWEMCDFVYVIGDAYVDHPSFGHAIISRVLEANGYKIGIISQPNWKNVDDFKKLGKPRLGFLVASGNVDSMVDNYSVFKKKRKKDFYSPGGEAGHRPDRAVTVYCNRIREAYKDVPIIIGGIEASLRRFAHYDYWEDKIRKSILVDSRADLLIYGMGEKPIIEVADALNAEIAINDIRWIKGTSYKSKEVMLDEDTQALPTFEEISNSRKKYAESFMTQYNNNNHYYGKTLVEQYDKTLFVVQNPPQDPLETIEMDRIYDMPYEYNYHPIYESKGGVPAIEEVKFSLTSTRGCFGSCSFCALAYHQGRIVQPRGAESIVEEGIKITEREGFKGYIHDVGGPTANFREAACDKQKQRGSCKNKYCLFPTACTNLKVNHKEYISILRRLRKIPKVKKVFVRSGVRFDYAIYDKDKTFIKELCEHHVSGILKVAPEHVSENVLEKMGKPKKEVFEKFVDYYTQTNKKLGKDQYLVPYFISSHPGSTLKDAIELAVYLNEKGTVPDQVQDFYPTPGTLSTCMYYTGLDPRNMEKVYIPNTIEEKKMQRALMHFKKPENYNLVIKALRKAGREDLIGFEKRCLVRPYNRRTNDEHNNKASSNNRTKQGKTGKNNKGRN